MKPIVEASLLCCSLLACSDEGTSSSSQGGGGATGDSTSSSTSASSGSTSTAAGGGGPVSETHLVGRYDNSSGTPRASWSASAARTRIAGDSVSVRLDGAQGIFYEIVIDGASIGRFSTDGGEQLYPLASGLAPGEHEVEIVRRNEGFFGVTGFLGFETPGSSIVPTPWPYAHRIEFIGDSLTCGYGIEGADANCSFSADTENAFASYASVAARQVGAAANLICYSGKGVHQNYGGDTNEPMPELYGRTLTDDTGLAWDFGGFAAEAVVINLGSNDFSAPLDDAAFVADYGALLTTVRNNYPSARIFAVTWSNWGASDEALVAQAVSQSGDGNLRTLQFTIDPADGFGCDYHTNVTTNAKLGALLSQTLKTELGW